MRKLVLRGALPALVVAAVWGLAAFSLVQRHPAPAAAFGTGTGPTFAVGTPSFSGGRVIVPIYATGSGVDPYFGFMVHLTWNADLFAFDSASAVGGVFDPVSGIGACDRPFSDAGGGGVIYGCNSRTGNLTGIGLLATIALIPRQTGCSPLHLVTAGPPDNGGTVSGTLTWDVNGIPQANAYIDGSTTDSGLSCTPGTPTPGTPFPTFTPTPSPTPPPGGPTPTPINSMVGPNIEVGSVSIIDGKVSVPVLTSGTGFNRYAGANVHLRWDPAIFAFGNVTAVGGLFDPALNAVCPPSLVDADGGGVTYGCVMMANSTLSTGLLATFTLVPVGSGCSPLHLFTVGSPDNGQSTFGTYTMSTQSTVQDNTLADGSVCVPPDAATPTATATSTATATATSTTTPTPTATATATLPTNPTSTATATATLPTNPTPTATATATLTTNPTPTPTATATLTTNPTPTATATPTPVNVCARADVNRDGKVNVLDLVAIARHLGKAYDPAFDLNGDGKVSAADLLVVVRCRSRGGG